MAPTTVAIDPVQGGKLIGSDGRLEINIPTGAVSADDVTTAGGRISLLAQQIGTPSGGNGGGSGKYTFGIYLLQVVDAQGKLLPHGLRQPVTVTLHIAGREGAVDLTNANLLVNAGLPKSAALNPDPAGASLSPAQAGLGSPGSLSLTPDASQGTLATPVSLSTPSTSLSFNTDSPVATFGRPDIFNADLNAGALTAGFPIDLPVGPGGLVPPLKLAYDSASVNEQHNPQGAAGWVGLGWNLSMGSISWAEHNVAGAWQDTWELNDLFGTSAQLVPSTTNVSTYFDDTGHGITPSPQSWRTVPESHTRIISFVGPVTPARMTRAAPCFRVYLTNGIMEEFGCTTDSLQYYPTSAGNQYAFAWHLDLITDRHGDQIHVGYYQDTEIANGKSYPRDVVPQYIQWDSPTCRNGDTECPQSSTQWEPLLEVAFNATHIVSYLDPQTPSCQPQSGNLRCDDPADWTSHGGLPAPEVQNTYVLNDIYVHIRNNGTPGTPWNLLRHYKLTYLQTGQGQVQDPISGLWQSVPGRLLLTQITELGDDDATALPVRYFGYNSSPLTNTYEDSSNQAPAPRVCPSWWPSGCPLWSQSYGGNSWYLVSANNGLGLTQSFSWTWARPNTHGVSSGSPTDPTNCDGAPWASYPCREADDENWSRMVLQQQTGTVYSLTLTGSVAVTSQTNYAYQLSTLVAQACSDCKYGFTWGDRTDTDYLDYYNESFMGFTQVRVTTPDDSVTNRDGSLVTHIYPPTEGWGVWDVPSACNGWSYCSRAPWWDPNNALHGHETETDFADTSGATVLRQVKTTYALACRPAGSVPSWSGHWADNIVAELDPDNPIAVCDIHVGQVDTYEGGTSSSIPPVPHQAISYIYDGDGTFYGRETLRTVWTDNGGSPGSPPTILHKTEYVWNDHVTATSTGVTGVFLTDPVAFTDTEDPSANQSDCTYTSWSSQPWQGNVNAGSVVLPDATEIDRSTACGHAIAKPTGPSAITVTHTYDAWGNQLTTIDPDRHLQPGCSLSGTVYSDCRAYDSTTFATHLVSEINALGQTTNTGYTQSAAAGYGLWPTSKTDANQQTTAYGYDALGRIASQTLPGDTGLGWTVAYFYYSWCLAGSPPPQAPCVEVDVRQRFTSNSGGMTSRAFYDGWGHPVETLAVSPTSGSNVVRFTDYYNSGKVAAQSVAYLAPGVTPDYGPGPNAYSIPDRAHQAVTTATYDGLGRVTSATDPLSHSTTNTISTACGVVAGDSACYEQTLTVDPRNHQSGGFVDAFGRQIYMRRFTGSQAGSYATYATTHYAYDTNGSVTGILGPEGGQIAYSYDTAGREVGVADPDLGHITYGYDADSNRTSTTDQRPNGAGTFYVGYDGLDRPAWHSTNASGTSWYEQLAYDAFSNTGTTNYGVGHLTSEIFKATPASTMQGEYDYRYDIRGQQISTQLKIGAGPAYNPIGTNYDDAGNVTSVTYPTGDLLTYGYWTGVLDLADSVGWITSASLQQGSSNTSLLSNVSYTGTGGAAHQITGATLGSGSLYSASYDALLHATDIRFANGSTTVFDQNRTFDASGNVNTIATTLPGGTDNQAFCYDEQNRLTWAGSTGTPTCATGLSPGSLSAAFYTHAFAYDDQGRLTSGPVGTYAYGGPLHGATAIGNAWTAAYDLAGNMTCRAPTNASTCAGTPTGPQLSYDVEDRLASWQNTPTNPTTTGSYLYDPEGNRVESQVTQNGTTTTTVFYKDLQEIVTAGSTTTTTNYYSVGGWRLAMAVNGTLFYLASDGLGSANEAFTATGSPTAGTLYAPYGTLRYITGTMPTDYGFTGQHSDVASTGLDYYTARYYDPVAGQFTSADSVLPGGGFDVFGLSRYAYAEGNPTSRTDPTGHCFLVCAVVGAIVGAGVSYGIQVAANLASGQSLGHALTHVDVGQIVYGAAWGALIGGTLGTAAPALGAAARAGVGGIGSLLGRAGAGEAGAAPESGGQTTVNVVSDAGSQGAAVGDGEAVGVGSLFSRAGIRTNADVLANGGGLPRTQATVADIASRAGVPLENTTVHIIDESEPGYIGWLDSKGANAVTPSELGGSQIDLGPAAFTDDQMLARTLGHEWEHVLQLRSGAEVGSASLDALESAAYAAEQGYVDRLLGVQ